jgi:hypothetical protein
LSFHGWWFSFFPPPLIFLALFTIRFWKKAGYTPVYLRQTPVSFFLFLIFLFIYLFYF